MHGFKALRGSAVIFAKLLFSPMACIVSAIPLPGNHEILKQICFQLQNVVPLATGQNETWHSLQLDYLGWARLRDLAACSVMSVTAAAWSSINTSGTLDQAK